MLPDLSPLHAFGWSDRVAALIQPLLATTSLDGGTEPARVIAVERGAVRVATAGGERWLAESGLAVGDWLAVRADRLIDVMPRWSSLDRLDPDHGRQVLAANLDVVLVAAPADRLSAPRVEREVVIAWDSGARPVVVVTKADLAETDEELSAAISDLRDRLVASDVLETSAVDGRGLDELRALLVHPTTAVLLGPSGAGKSTLVNALVGSELLAVGAVRELDQRGRHTTSSRRLVPLPTGGSLVDMPGLRSLGTDASDESIAAAFPEIEELAAECRFADCTHRVEPGCAVQRAVADGSLDRERFESFSKLERELAYERRREDPLLRQEAQRQWKAIHKAHRADPKRDGRR